MGLIEAERLVLDTSAYSKMRQGHAAALDWLATAQQVVVPAVVIGELEAGFELGHRAAENRLSLAAFLEEPFVSVQEVSRSVAGHFGRVYARLRRAGTPIPVNDIWIAACTLEIAGILLSFDRDFESVEGLPRVILA